MRRDPFQAIADPTRRQIIQLLSTQSLNLNAIADQFRVSRPAISKQVKILHECGLITIRDEGRERLCEANLETLKPVSQWIDQYRVFWTNKLDALDNFLNTPEPKRSSPKKSTANLPTNKKNKRK